MFSSCFPGACLNLSDEDNVVALALAECSARPYAELIKSNIPSSSSLMSHVPLPRGLRLLSPWEFLPLGLLLPLPPGERF